MLIPQRFAPLTLPGLLLLPVSLVHADVDLGLISSDALIEPPVLVGCELENGEASDCVQVIVKYKPDNLTIGPFCPESLDETGGIWNWDGEQAGLYRLDGDFFEMLAESGFDFTDEGNKINISDPAAGRPPADHACLEASEDASVEITMLIPAIPQRADEPTDLGTVAKVGLALDGVPVFADAPSVLQTGHLPALDTCGGHVDPGGWYHWHTTSTDIDSLFEHSHVDADCALPQSTDALFGYAFDGYPMFGSTDSDGVTPSDLDACHGHTGPTELAPQGQYHYHSTAEFPNLPACLMGVQAVNNFVTTASNGIGAVGGPGGGAGGPPPGFAEAAEKLGVSEQSLMQAVRDAGGPQLDIDKASATLGVAADDLRAALPKPPGK